MEENLNELTQCVYDAIIYYLERDRKSPSLRQIGQHCFVSHTTVITHLARLEGMGWVERDIGEARSIRLGARAPHVMTVIKKRSIK